MNVSMNNPNFVVGLQIGCANGTPSVASGDAAGITVPGTPTAGTTQQIVGCTIAFLSKCQQVSLVNLSGASISLVASQSSPSSVPGNSVTLKFVKIADFPCCGSGW